MIFPLLFVFLCGCFNQAGSLVLTSSPLTATEGELFTLICSSNKTGVQVRYWNRDGPSPVFYTKQASTNYTLSNPNAFNRYLSGRINASCDATQHNVTLRINSTIDNGSRWQCEDTVNSQRSNTLTIIPTTTTTDITHTGHTGVESDTPTSTTWKPENTTLIFTLKTTTTSNNINKNASGKPISTAGSTTNNNNNNNAAGESTGQSDTIAIAAGAAGGGVAVIAIVIVTAVCIRKRRRSVEENVTDKTRRERNPSRSAQMLIESGVTGEDEKVMMDNIIYTSSSEVVPAEYSIQDHNQANKDVYTEVKKVKTNADQHEVTDVYAKPHKGLKETPNGDMYAQVNKVKSREGTSGNIEDMYAKPQKDKRNVKSNADSD